MKYKCEKLIKVKAISERTWMIKITIAKVKLIN